MVFDGNNTESEAKAWYSTYDSAIIISKKPSNMYCNVFIHDLNDSNEFLIHNYKRRHCVSVCVCSLVDLESGVYSDSDSHNNNFIKY